MLKQDIYKCSLILAPATIEEEQLFRNTLYALYALYRNKETNEIEIGIPGMINHTSLHNMDNFDEAVEKAYFINLGYAGIDVADIITDRPIYMIDPTDHRTVGECTLVNGVEIELSDILKGNIEKRIKLK